MSIRNNYTGVILAGGMSSRYGSPKAFAQYNGKAFFEIAYEVLLTFCRRVMIVTREELKPKFPKSLEVVVDLPSIKGKGPLAGIYTAMSTVDSENYVVLPCDLPLMTAEVIKYLVERHHSNVTVAKMNGKIEPLVSIWSQEMKALINTSIKNNQLAMNKMLDTNFTNIVPLDHLHPNRPVFMNVNTRENERELRKWTPLSMHSEDQ